MFGPPSAHFIMTKNIIYDNINIYLIYFSVFLPCYYLIILGYQNVCVEPKPLARYIYWI